MSGFRHYTLAKQTFHGARFEDHGLDLDVLPEIQAFKSLIAEVAKDLWRRKNSERERLAVNFEDRFSVKVFSIQAGSATIPLERIYRVEDEGFMIEPPDDEFDEAVDLVTDSIAAVQNDRRLPIGISRRVIPMFAKFTEYLRPDEAISFVSGRSGKNARFNRDTKLLFEGRITTDFQDEITVRGELRSVNLDSRTFTLRLDDESKVSGKFSENQESLITQTLRDHRSSHLEIKGVALFEGTTGEILRIENVHEFRVLSVAAVSSTAARRPIWETAEEVGSNIPEEERDKVPDDAAINLDHYLYRAPKEGE
jgi:hypothetical protein